MAYSEWSLARRYFFYRRMYVVMLRFYQGSYFHAEFPTDVLEKSLDMAGLELLGIIEIGIDSALYSSHSFRRGFSTLSFKNNASADKISILGAWRSDVYKRYISLNISDKLNIIRSISHNFCV
ncbi:hypothetical protein MAR_008034 [Mya arenaria]|uniref:Uncharacterized protein n=1 Tax=Mya arenaria TaxID=6604 RepID=A0ABY7DXS0_MYAAR|nr:hypothetical protein MAR_008034 [Mya arenaria]